MTIVRNSEYFKIKIEINRLILLLAVVLLKYWYIVFLAYNNFSRVFQLRVLNSIFLSNLIFLLFSQYIFLFRNLFLTVTTTFHLFTLENVAVSIEREIWHTMLVVLKRYCYLLNVFYFFLITVVKMNQCKLLPENEEEVPHLTVRFFTSVRDVHVIWNLKAIKKLKLKCCWNLSGSYVLVTTE